MPVRKSSRPVFEVSMWPLNIRFFPPPQPVQRPITLARPSSTSCHVTVSPSCCSTHCMYCAISSSSPVGLGMLITSQHIATISSSLISVRTLSASFEFNSGFESLFDLATVRFPALSSPHQASRKSSGYEHSFSLPVSVIRKLSSNRNPPPPDQ